MQMIFKAKANAIAVILTITTAMVVTCGVVDYTSTENSSIIAVIKKGDEAGRLVKGDSFHVKQ